MSVALGSFDLCSTSKFSSDENSRIFMRVFSFPLDFLEVRSFSRFFQISNLKKLKIRHSNNYRSFGVIMGIF